LINGDKDVDFKMVIPKEIRYCLYTDYITFLVTNKLDNVKWVVKRKFENNPFPHYYYIDRTYSDSYKE